MSSLELRVILVMLTFRPSEILRFDFPVGESFASGIFLGAGLLHMLPNAGRHFSKAGYHYPFTFLIAFIGT